MKPLSPDTSADAQRMQFELLRRLSPAQKLAFAFELTDALRDLILADLHHRFPQADERPRSNGDLSLAYCRAKT